MQLKKIKLVGFKSFVDPTTVTLPGQLIAVVGPNGCGKSNIIDAVCWVMGENSPKYLRGESLSDVIFNGSSARKPVGQASVELVFDNQDGSLTGEYAKFSEIAIKRQLARDSDSFYSLNGTRCRRKDIVDIFLGTGLGPRSYSIIGQNMISRVIEAKPDEMRTYLEEAAGISKYKERRRETENRIQHTKENLSRVNDLRGELEKQLNNLKRQANAAERFKTLKEQERLLRAQWYAIQWRHYDAQIVECSLKIHKEETAFEAHQSDISGIDREMEQIRHEQRTANDAFQQVQRRYYAVGNEITRIEQDVLHQQERQQQWEHDLKQVEHDSDELKTQLETNEDEIREYELESRQLEEELNSTSAEENNDKIKLLRAEEAVQAWQSQWDEFNQHAAKAEQTAQVEKTKVQHLEQKVASLKKSYEKLQQEQSQINFVHLEKEIEGISKQSFEMTDLKEVHEKRFNQNKKEIADIQAAQQESIQRLDQMRSELQQLNGHKASLDALQQTALGQQGNPALPWLKEHRLDNKLRLAQNLNVEEGWEWAVEKVLGTYLQAICVDDLNDIYRPMEHLQTGNLVFMTQADDPISVEETKGVLLQNKIKTDWPVATLLNGIYAVETLEEALKLCQSLGPNESVVTKEGVWLNRAWLKIFKQKDAAAGVFQREQELKDLAKRIKTLESSRQELEKNITLRKEQLAELEKEREGLDFTGRQYHAQSVELLSQQKMKEERLGDIKKRLELCAKAQEENLQQLQAAQIELTHSLNLQEKALNDLSQHIKQRESLNHEREKVRQDLQVARETSHQIREQIHSLEIRLQTTRSQKAAMQQNIVRMQTQLATLAERKISLQSELSSILPLDTLKKALSRALDKHVSTEVELNTARVSMEALDQEVRRLEENRQTIERETLRQRANLEALRLEAQGLKIKAEGLIDQIKQTDFTLEDVLKDLTADVSAHDWEAQIVQLEQRINRLGPINLIAIEEYASCLERKEYLDKQCEDLQSGLATLEEAIAKIDKETRTRFKDTYDQVNQRFQELFPTVFGGGKAYLELTSDNLLDAGVTVMACPPGKRNSSIHLLSGGEKTMTAIALVFSIFYLNPAPFCLLDEVDAALDDANVLRFCKLVKDMSQQTQFIYISHNKLAIEMADNLLGVTMHEPGVSRLVSVDVQEAVNLAGS